MEATHPAVQSAPLPDTGSGPKAPPEKDVQSNSGASAPPKVRPRRVLLAGSWDFLSQAITRHLEGQAHHVACVTLHHGHDIRNPVEALQAAMLVCPEVIVHVQGHGLSTTNQQLTDILEGGMSVARAAALSGARLVLVQCYHEYPVGHALDTISLLAGSYPSLDFAALRLPPLMGPGNHDQADILQQICEVVFRGSQMGVSDWVLPSDGKGQVNRLHVDDVARLVGMLVSSEEPAGGRRIEVPVSRVGIGRFIELALKASGYPGTWKPLEEDVSWNTQELVFKMPDIQGWAPSDLTPEQVALMVAARGVQLSRAASAGG